MPDDAYGNKENDEALWLVCCGFHKFFFALVNYGREKGCSSMIFDAFDCRSAYMEVLWSSAPFIHINPLCVLF